MIGWNNSITYILLNGSEIWNYVTVWKLKRNNVIIVVLVLLKNGQCQQRSNECKL